MKRIRIASGADFIAGRDRYRAGQEYVVPDDLVLPKSTKVLEEGIVDPATEAPEAEAEIEPKEAGK